VKNLASTVDKLSSTIDDLSSAAATQRSTMDDLMTGFVTLAELAKSHEN
jgi:hypothetical protein